LPGWPQENKKHFRQDTRSTGQESNIEPLEYKTKILAKMAVFWVVPPCSLV
jgi:hypothetical protein